MTLTSTQLHTEITTDPNNYGLVALNTAGRDADIAAALNLVRTGSNGGPQIQVTVNNASVRDFINALRVADVAALSQGQRDWLGWAMSGTVIDFTEANFLADIQSIFPSGTTRNDLSVLAVRNGSRAEQLGGTGTAVSAHDVAVAMRGAS